jgi:anti-sigma B factor antagonist
VETHISASHQRNGSLLTVTVAGEVDLMTGPVVDEAITTAVAADGVTAIEVDLSGVEFLDSSGIALLLRGRRRADARGLTYRVTGARGIVLQVLQLSGVWPHLCGDSVDNPSPAT